jgi:integrase
VAVANKLTTKAVDNAKPKEKPYKLADGEGLFLLVNPGGSRLWRLKYRHGGKEKLLSFGTYPKVGLAQARRLRDDARKLIEDGADPSAERKAEKQRTKIAAGNSFEMVAREFIGKRRDTWSPSHSDYVLGRMVKDVFPTLGAKPIDEIGARDLLAVLNTVERRGAVEMAHRIRSFCGQVFRYGIANARCTRDVAADLVGALTPRKPEHMAAVPLEELPELLRRINASEEAPYFRNRLTRIYLQLCLLTFVRPGELRKAVWPQFDMADAMWTLPAGVMKRRREHMVPLSQQAITLLEELREISGRGAVLFPGEGAKKIIMSENTGSYALHALGYKDRQTPHGFRALASTVLNESKHFDVDAIEMQLAHVEGSASRRPYNRARYLDIRTPMMQWWADYLDELRQGAFVKPAKFRAPPLQAAA